MTNKHLCIAIYTTIRTSSNDEQRNRGQNIRFGPTNYIQTSADRQTRDSARLSRTHSPSETEHREEKEDSPWESEAIAEAIQVIQQGSVVPPTKVTRIRDSRFEKFEPINLNGLFGVCSGRARLLSCRYRTGAYVEIVVQGSLSGNRW